MKSNYKPRYATCKCGELDNPVEPNQVMSIQQMLIAYTKGLPMPDKHATSYDENITIDEVGYSVGDRLEAVDYLNAVNQRIASSKKVLSEDTTTPTVETTPTDNE